MLDRCTACKHAVLQPEVHLSVPSVRIACPGAEQHIHDTCVAIEGGQVQGGAVLEAEGGQQSMAPALPVIPPVPEGLIYLGRWQTEAQSAAKQPIRRDW